MMEREGTVMCCRDGSALKKQIHAMLGYIGGTRKAQISKNLKMYAPNFTTEPLYICTITSNITPNFTTEPLYTCTITP